jgi:hypothetical protein
VANVVHIAIIVGFGTAAIVLPSLILRFRRTVATLALCGMIWCVLAAGIVATANDVRGHLHLDYVDALRIAAIACFLVFALSYDLGPPGDGANDR